MILWLRLKSPDIGVQLEPTFGVWFSLHVSLLNSGDMVGVFIAFATVVAERLCFYRCLSVQGDGGGVLPSGRHLLSLSRHPLGKHPPEQAPPGRSPWANPPGTDTSWANTPLADTPPPKIATAVDSTGMHSCCNYK